MRAILSQAAAGGASTLNGLLDALPRPRIFRGSCERPTFRSMGVAGYHAALIATFAAGLIAGRSLLVLAAISAVCAISFFAWAHLRRALTGRETLVLLEHVWVAELASAGVLRLLGEPILLYLDTVSVGLAVFLTWGRIGCLLVGCCHGHPASVGVRYGPDQARDGFPEHLVGVRLFPVQAIEALGLVAIALVSLGLASGAVEGRALTWFLASYAVLRFGLESLRGDPRPHALGFSQARWMALGEFSVALALGERGAPPGRGRIAAGLFLLSTLLVSLFIARRSDRRPRLLDRSHLADLRARARAAIDRARHAGPTPVPDIGRTAQWVSVGVSLIDGGGAAHISLCLPAGQCDLHLLCDVAAGALPELDPLAGRTAPPTLLHLRVPLPLAEALPPVTSGLADRLYGAALRRQQAADEDQPEAQPEPRPPALTSPSPEPDPPAPPSQTQQPARNGPLSPWDRRIHTATDDAQSSHWQRAPTHDDGEA